MRNQTDRKIVFVCAHTNNTPSRIGARRKGSYERATARMKPRLRAEHETIGPASLFEANTDLQPPQKYAFVSRMG